MKYSQSTTGQNRTGTMQNGQFRIMGGQGTNRTGQNRTGQFINGEVISKDDKSITVRLPDKNTQLVYFSPSTTISKIADAKIGDLIAGTTIIVTGNNDSGNIITAQTIQIKPDGQMFPFTTSTRR